MNLVIKTPLNYFDKNLNWYKNEAIKLAKLSNCSSSDIANLPIFGIGLCDYIAILGLTHSDVISVIGVEPQFKRKSDGTIYLKITNDHIHGYIVSGKENLTVFAFPNLPGTYIEMCDKYQSNVLKVQL